MHNQAHDDAKPTSRTIAELSGPPITEALHRSLNDAIHSGVRTHQVTNGEMRNAECRPAA